MNSSKICRRGTCLLLFFLSCVTSQRSDAQAVSQPEPGFAKPAGAQMTAQPTPEPIVSSFKKTVIFIETDCLEMNAASQPTIAPHLGTGFLIFHHDERFPQIGGFNYLVTNKHVALPGIENSEPCKIVDYKVRFNLRSKGSNGLLSDAVSIGPSIPWVYASDSSVDLAVLPFGLDPNIYNFKTIPSSLFLSQTDAEKEHVVEGDSVLFTGLFVQFLGQMKLEPIVREGRIALIPDESIPTTLRSLGKLYLVDSHVFGGNSGSPIWVNLGGQRDNGLMAGYNYRLLGVISGYVQETSDLKLQAVASYAGTVVANSGIALVVPAQYLIDVLNSTSLQAQRGEIAAHMPTPPASPH